MQVYVVSLAPGVHPDNEMRKQLEDTAKGARRAALPTRRAATLAHAPRRAAHAHHPVSHLLSSARDAQ